MGWFGTIFWIRLPDECELCVKEKKLGKKRALIFLCGQSGFRHVFGVASFGVS